MVILYFSKVASNVGIANLQCSTLDSYNAVSYVAINTLLYTDKTLANIQMVIVNS